MTDLSSNYPIDIEVHHETYASSLSATPRVSKSSFALEARSEILYSRCACRRITISASCTARLRSSTDSYSVPLNDHVGTFASWYEIIAPLSASPAPTGIAGECR